MNQATKANIRDIISALGGELAARNRLKKAIGPAAESLAKVTPDDVVIISFSGHGHTDPQGRFYLLPSDSGPDGIVDKDRLLKFVSSDELSQWLRSIDAGQLVLIIDACHSAASVPPGFKPGPMGDRGLGQLAYDKGMLLLAATQADDIALESKKLGQGLLTYALVQEGLKGRKASTNRDEPITIKAWLSYAESRVPTLYREVLSGKLKALRMVEGDAKDLAVKDSDADLSTHRHPRCLTSTGHERIQFLRYNRLRIV
jgi:uncharacterized caspase-like protein